jgi:hypothetical protein
MRMSKSSFRALLVTAVVLAIIGGVLNTAIQSSLPAPLAEYKQAELDADLTAEGLLLLALVLVWVFAGLVATVGLLAFWRPARVLAIAATVLGELMMPLAGPTVESAWASMLDDSASILWGAVLALAYCPPVREWFEKKPAAPEPPVGDLRSRWSG